MTISVLWTLLPNGIDPTGKIARLSLVASPRAAGPVTKIAPDSGLARWPTLVVELLDRLTVVVAGSGDRIPARIVSPPPDQALWDQLVPQAHTTVVPFAQTQDTPILIATETNYSMKPAIASVASLYTEATSLERSLSPDAQSPTTLMIEGLRAWMGGPPPEDNATARRTREAMTAVRSPTVADLLHPQQLTAERVEQAAALLREQGHGAAAAAIPLVPILNRLRVARGATSQSKRLTPGELPAHPGILERIPATDQAELHQMLGLYLDHPSLALRLGLRIDLEIPVFTGQRLIRIGDANGAPLNGEVPIPQPWSAVICDPPQRRFFMATQPDAPGVEIREGMLDLRSESKGYEYVVTDIDPVGVAEQIATMAGNNPLELAPLALPVRRDIGLVLAQVDRRTKALAHRIRRMERFQGGKGVDEVEGAPVLFADDVTTGYRIDVAKDRDPFRSLMRRQVKYAIADPNSKIPPKVIANITDEGWLEPFTPVEQRDENNVPHLFIGEELCRWNGWALAAPQPGLIVGAEGAGANPVTVPDRRPFPKVPLLIDTAVEPGTLTRLRYGATYQFQARAVDLAGNSIDPAIANSTLATTAFRFLRHEPVPSPTLVPRRAFESGESLLRLVVRTDGDNQGIGTTCERHVAAPKISQQMAERHGLFDAALGPKVSAAERDRQLAIAKREAGTFLDAVSSAPGGIITDPIRVVTNIGAPPPKTQLPIPRGQALLAGEYVVHDLDNAQLPYLPDVVSAGSAWLGLPGGRTPVVIPWSDRPWPEAPPHRLVLQAGTTAKAEVIPPRTAKDRPVLVVTLPPATEIQVRLSSALTPAGLAVMDPLDPDQQKAAIAGQLPLCSPAETITLVHAVRKPVQAPTLTLQRLLDQSSDTDRPRGSTWARLKGSVTAHAPSTAQVEVEGTWTEIIDRGYGPVLFEPRRSVAGLVAVERDDTGALPFEAIHDLGDTKRRIVTYRPVATTRFREYFVGLEAGQQSLVRAGESVVMDIPAARRPDPPQIHSVIPLLRHSRTVSNGQLTSTRSCIGVRIYLKRPWFTTGEGERLGVSVPTTAEFGNTIAQFDALRDLVSRWGCDPFQSMAPGKAPHLVPEMILNGKEQQDSAQIPDNPEGALGHTVIGLEVHFDAERDLWYADLELNLGSTQLINQRFPMLRLALVRFQPGSFEFSPECSRLVHTDFIPLLPNRTLTARKKLVGSQTVIELSISGARLTPIVATWQRRMLTPLVKSGADLYVDATEIPAVNFQLHASQPPVVINPSGQPIFTTDETQPRSATGILNTGNVSGTALDELLAGRVVVREQEPSWSLVRPTEIKRTVWFDTFDIAELDAN